MRQQNRIPIILDVLKGDENKKKILEYWFKPKKGVQMEIDMPFYDIENIFKRWQVNQNLIEEVWIENPDLRLPQILIYTNVMSNYPGHYYYIEDEDLMLKTELLEPRDIYFWGQNYTKNGERLLCTKFILIKNMETDHIKAILGDYSPPTVYKNVFEEELRIREQDEK